MLCSPCFSLKSRQTSICCWVNPTFCCWVSFPFFVGLTIQPFSFLFPEKSTMFRLGQNPNVWPGKIHHFCPAKLAPQVGHLAACLHFVGRHRGHPLGRSVAWQGEGSRRGDRWRTKGFMGKYMGKYIGNYGIEDDINWWFFNGEIYWEPRWLRNPAALWLIEIMDEWDVDHRSQLVIRISFISSIHNITNADLTNFFFTKKVVT